MDIQAYISSGILESYVLGLLPEVESREVELLIKQYPEIKAEVENISLSMENYALKYSNQPPADLKNNIMASLDFEEDDNEIDNISPAFKVSVPEPGPEVLKDKQRSFSSWAPYMAAASVALFLVSMLVNFVLFNRLNTANQLVEELQIIKADYDDARSQLAVYTNPENKLIRLTGVEIAPEAQAVIYWNGASKEVFLGNFNLPAPPKGKQYQLWAFVNGVPVPAGMIESGEQGSLQRMETITVAEGFAITLEKTGGNPTPQGELYVKGTV